MQKLLTRSDEAEVSMSNQTTSDRSGARWMAPAAAGETDVKGNTSSRREVVGTSPARLRVRADADWSRAVWGNVVHYARLRENWDSYGALPLSYGAIVGLSNVMQRIYDSVNRAPEVSMLVDGGLVCEWTSPDAELSLTCLPNGEVMVEYEDVLTREQFELPSDDVPDLGKRIWETSLA